MIEQQEKEASYLRMSVTLDSMTLATGRSSDQLSRSNSKSLIISSCTSSIGGILSNIILLSVLERMAPPGWSVLSAPSLNICRVSQ